MGFSHYDAASKKEIGYSNDAYGRSEVEPSSKSYDEKRPHDRKRPREEDDFSKREVSSYQPSKYGRSDDEANRNFKRRIERVDTQFERTVKKDKVFSRPSSFSHSRFSFSKEQKGYRGMYQHQSRVSFASKGRSQTSAKDIPLKREYFKLIQNGSKTIEGRLNKGPFQFLKPGEEVAFWTTDYGVRSEVKCRIEDIRYYPDFKAMLEGEDKRKENGLQSVLPGVKSIDEGVHLYENIPSYMQQLATYHFSDPLKKVMAIEVKRI